MRVNPQLRIRLAAALAALGGLLAACHPPSPAEHADILLRGLAGEPSTLDPAVAADTFSTNVLIDLYEGLTTEAPSGDVVPGVASSWTVDPSGTEYTFQLRSDARWSNGQSVKAQDFVHAWRREIDPKFGSPSADDLRLIGHAAAILVGKEPPTNLAAAAVSDSVLVVRLERPAPFFLQILAHPSSFPIYSDEAAGTHEPDKWVSNGPYTLSAWKPTTGLDLIANPHYWAHDRVRIPRVKYRFITSDAGQYDAYRAGELDLTDIVPANALPTIRRERPSELLISPFLATAYYGINLANKNLATAALRQALAMAIDRKRLVESLGFGQVGAFGFVPPGTSNYTPQHWSWQSLGDAARIKMAQDLYAKAGFSSTKPLRLRVLLNHNEVIERTAVLIAAMWRETLGIETDISTEEYKVFLQSRHDTSRWDVARLAWNADFNDASNFLDVLRTRSPNNDMSYTNAQFDNDLDRAAKTVDPAGRRPILESAEELMLNEYPVIPLYFFVSKRLIKPYLHGVAPNPLNHVPSKSLWLDR
jgi:oligopeptide transport system substrate-binding protein